MKKNKWIYLGIFILFFFYFSFSMNIFWDTGHYMSFVSIFEGDLPWQSWDIVRGPVFPAIIFISNIIFGKTTQGILFLSFIFYLIMLFIVNNILKEFLKKENKIVKKISYGIVYGVIILNPIIFGYYHALLTEFIAMTISILMCYLSWEWLNIDFFDNRKKYLIYSLVFFVGVILSWHLKQPYVSITLFPLLIAMIISIGENCNLKNIVSRVSTFVLCIIGLVGSILLWNQFLVSKNIDINTDRNVTASFGKQLIIGLNNYELVDRIDRKDLTKSEYLTEKEIDLLINQPKEYSLVNINNISGKIIDQTIISKNKLENITTSTAVKFILTQFLKHPILVLESYTSNYLAIANLYSKGTNDNVSYWVNKDLTLNYCHENCSIATNIYMEKSNVSYMPEDSYNRVINYEQYNDAPIFFRYILKILSPISEILFKLVMILLPIMTLLGTVSRLRKNKYNNKTLNIVLILLWYSLMHVLIHVATGANIDRYASPVYITSLIGILLYIYVIIKNKKNIGNRSGKNEKKYKRK